MENSKVASEAEIGQLFWVPYTQVTPSFPMYFHAFALQNGGHGMFNVRNDLSACHAHEGETGADESAQALTQIN